MARGSALLISGKSREARESLKKGGLRIGAVYAPMIQVVCLAQLAALSLDEGDSIAAEILYLPGPGPGRALPASATTLRRPCRSPCPPL